MGHFFSKVSLFIDKKEAAAHLILDQDFATAPFFFFRDENVHFFIFGLAESESWRIEVYQSCYYDLGLDNKIKQMMGYGKRSENQC